MAGDDSTEDDDQGGWPLRPPLLAAIGAVIALIMQQLLAGRAYAPPPDRLALAIGLGTAGLGFAIAAERARLWWSIVFAIVIGLVAGGVSYWQGGPAGTNIGWRWDPVSLLLAIAIATPLFQTARDHRRWHFPYADLHGHAWTNIVLWCGGWIFVGIVFALSWLLAALFRLIRIDFLQQLLEKSWFSALLVGAALGGAFGLLRERDRIVRLAQRVVTAVLGVLAPVLGLGLLLFLAALLFTGLDDLWATRAAAATLLACVIGALILANAVIGNGAEDAARNPVLRLGAMALGAALLPLAVLAAIAIGLRIGQYGFTPDRLWAAVFAGLANAYGLAYLASLGLGRMDWAPIVRRANVALAFGVAALALILATPIVGFNAISVADQVQRLQSGRVTPARFDWAALAFDFGPPGRAALDRLAASTNAEIAEHARGARVAKARYELQGDPTARPLTEFARQLRVVPNPIALPDRLIWTLKNNYRCAAGAGAGCIVYYTPRAEKALLVQEGCDNAEPPVGKSIGGDGCSVTVMRLIDGEWKVQIAPKRPDLTDVERRQLADGLRRGAFELRSVERRQLFIGGVPVGDAFE